MRGLQIHITLKGDPDPAFHINADPDQFFYFIADPNPEYHINADPDPSFYFNADPNPAPHQSEANLQTLVNRPSRAPF